MITKAINILIYAAVLCSLLRSTTLQTVGQNSEHGTRQEYHHSRIIDLFHSAPKLEQEKKKHVTLKGELRKRNVRVDFQDLLKIQQGTLTQLHLNLFKNTSFVGLVDHKRTVIRNDSSFTCFGQLTDDTSGTFALTYHDGAFAGIVRANKKGTYEIGSGRDALLYVTEIDPSYHPFCETIPTDNTPPSPHPLISPKIKISTLSTGPTDIEVMVIYTRKARSSAGTQAAIEARIILGMDQSNAALQRSLASTSFNLVGMHEVVYEESGFSPTDLSRIRNPTDGFMDEVHALREASKADIVSLVVSTMEGGVGGRAHLMTTLSTSFRDRAFNIVKLRFIASEHVLAHELAHNMGCAHNKENGGTGLFPYSHGWNLSPNRRTIMSVVLSKQRTGHFSNPNVLLEGSPTGDTSLANNVRSIDEAACTVDQFGNIGDESFDVFPGEGVTVSAPYGGPFAPAGFSYAIKNNGITSFPFMVTTSTPWIKTDFTEVVVQPATNISIHVTIDQALANTLGLGTHIGEVIFKNHCTGQLQIRRVTLLIYNPIFSVSPTTPQMATGVEGGPFTPLCREYMLQNTGEEFLNVQISTRDPWATITPDIVSNIAPNSAVSANICINEVAAAALPIGIHVSTVTFRDPLTTIAHTSEVQLAIAGDFFVSRVCQIPIASSLNELYGSTTSTLTVVQGDEIADLNVRLFMTHTTNSDLNVRLVSPQGTAIELFSYTSTSNGSLGNLCYPAPDFIIDDEANLILADESPPFSGRFQSKNSELNAFNGENPTGIWKIIVDDASGSSLNYIACWCLEIATPISGVADSDSDGIPDRWENEYNLDPLDDGSFDEAQGPSKDLDGDGISNWEEYVADTDPWDPLALFRATINPAASGLTFSFPSSTERLYRLEYRPMISSTNWIELTSEVQGTGVVHSLLHTNIVEGALYRTGVKLP